MTETPNHGYNVPEEGEEDWHRPLNENFEAYDTDIELRDEAANLENYEPQAGAKFLATDTGVVYVGDGSDWLATFQAGRYSAPSDANNAGGVAFGDPANDASGDGATVAGGQANEAPHDHCTVGGGLDNRASRNRATVGGGQGNQAVDVGATVGGGIDNRASGDGATVAGGRENIASGDDSFAAGRKAEARRTGSFVWNNSGSRFLDTDENQFLVNAVGGVGIGTNDPDAPLHVGSTDDPALEGDLKVGSSDHRFFVDVQQDGADSGTVHLLARGENDTGHNNLLLGAGERQLKLTDGFDDGYADEPRLVPIENEGVSLGVGDVGANLRFDGIYGKYMFADEVHENSDARLKQNVSRLEDGLETVSALRPVSYEWREENRQDGPQLGLIAQEVEEVVPEVVYGSDDDDTDRTLSISYSKLVPVLIDAIQRQQEGIEERDERIEDLEAAVDERDERVDDLEARLSALESDVRDDG